MYERVGTHVDEVFEDLRGLAAELRTRDVPARPWVDECEDEALLAISRPLHLTLNNGRR